MNNEFLDNKNFSYLINHVRNDVRQQADYDILQNKKYVNIFKKLIQTIHTSNMNKRVSKEHLNSIVIDKCVPFLVKQISTDNKKDMTFNISTPPIQTFERPKGTRVIRKKNTQGNNSNANTNANSNSKNDFSSLTLENDTQFNGLNNRQQRNVFLDNSPNSNPIDNIMGKSTRDGEKVDFMKRMQEMENERNYNKRMEDENQFDNQVSKANQQQKNDIQDINKKSIRNDNDFFKQLYQNNMENDNQQREDNPLKNQSYMAPIDDNDNSLDTLYSNDLNSVKDSLDNDPPPVSQQDLDSYLRSRSEMPSNYEENINMSVNDSNKINSEDIEPLLENSMRNEEKTTEYMNKTFQSTNKTFERRKKRVLTIDVSNNLEDVDEGRPAINNYSNNYWEHFKVNFQEDFVIDKISDVFLESITINNPAQANNYVGLYKVLDISEFNVKTTTNNNFMKDKFALPNENTASSGSNKIMKYHLKSNYIATVNPKTLSSLTFKLTNEDNDGVGVNLTASGSLVNLVAGYKDGVNDVVVDNHAHFSIFDAVYNGNKQFVGIVTGKTTGSHTLHFQNGTHVPLVNDEKLYITDTTYRTAVEAGDPADIGSTTIKVDNGNDNTDSVAVASFNIGEKVYLGNGALLGTLSNVAAQLLTFSSGIIHHVPDNVNIYKKNPLPKVFASDNASNRIIMEFMFINR
jgi:hypothetical protein